MANGVKFIRVHGRVVPIRNDKGADLRSKNSPARYSDFKATYAEAKKRTRPASLKQRAKGAAALGLGMGAFGMLAGTVTGVAADILSKGRTGLKGVEKGMKLGAAAGAILGAYAGATQEGANRRTWNKLAGQHAIKKLKKQK
jgi:hypothetical protein